MPEQVNRTQLDRVQAALLAVLIGDGMGMPWEIMTPEEILTATNDRGVTDFHAPVQRKIGGTRNLPEGHPTDDYQLTDVVAESLIACGGFDLHDIARRHVTAYEQSTMGWGGSTRRGIVQLKEFFDSGGARGRHWGVGMETSPQAPGTGNGIAIKVLPLAIWHAVQGRSTPPWEEVRAIGLLTHGDLRASLAAYAIASLAGYGLTIGTTPAAPAVRQELLNRICWFEQHVLPRDNQQLLSEKLQLASRSLDFPAALRDLVGTGCYCLESVPFAIGTFWRQPTNFSAAVLEAINAGGDTDSTAAMVGGLVGAHVGLAGIPVPWRTYQNAYADAMGLGERLYRAAAAARG